MRSLIVKEFNGNVRRRKVLRWNTEEEAFTWHQLLCKVEEAFSLPRSKIQLSLNHGKTFIEAEGSTTLSQLNIVNGDILTLVAQSDSSTSANPSPDAHEETIKSPTGESSSPEMETEPTVMASPNTYQLKMLPTLLRDVRGEELPLPFYQLLSEHGARRPVEQLILAIHTLMLESGFLYNQQNSEPLLDHIHKSQSLYKVPYNHVIHEDSRVTIACVPMANHLVVHAATPASRNLHLKLPTRHYLSEDGLVYSKLVQLSNSFKDQLVAPLILTMKEALNMEALPPVLDIPYELTMLIFSRLDFKSVCRLGSTCKHLSRVFKDNSLWKKLYRQRFGACEHTPIPRQEGYWYQQYKERVLSYKTYTVNTVRVPPLMPSFPYVDPFAPPVPHLPPPVRDDPANRGLLPLNQPPSIRQDYGILGLKPPTANPHSLRLF